MVPSFFSACCVAVSQDLFSEVSGALTQVSDCCPGCGDAWASFLRGAVDSFGLKTHLAANYSVVGVTVSAVVTAGTEDAVEKGLREITRSSWCQ